MGLLFAGGNTIAVANPIEEVLTYLNDAGRGSWCRRPRPRRCLDGAPDQVPAIGRSGG